VPVVKKNAVSQISCERIIPIALTEPIVTAPVEPCELPLLTPQPILFQDEISTTSNHSEELNFSNLLMPTVQPSTETLALNQLSTMLQVQMNEKTEHRKWENAAKVPEIPYEIAIKTRKESHQCLMETVYCTIKYKVTLSMPIESLPSGNNHLHATIHLVDSSTQLVVPNGLKGQLVCVAKRMASTMIVNFSIQTLSKYSWNKTGNQYHLKISVHDGNDAVVMAIQSAPTKIYSRKPNKLNYSTRKRKREAEAVVLAKNKRLKTPKENSPELSNFLRHMDNMWLAKKNLSKHEQAFVMELLKTKMVSKEIA